MRRHDLRALRNALLSPLEHLLNFTQNYRKPLGGVHPWCLSVFQGPPAADARSDLSSEGENESPRRLPRPSKRIPALFPPGRSDTRDASERETCSPSHQGNRPMASRLGGAEILTFGEDGDDRREQEGACVASELRLVQRLLWNCIEERVPVSERDEVCPQTPLTATDNRIPRSRRRGFCVLRLLCTCRRVRDRIAFASSEVTSLYRVVSSSRLLMFFRFVLLRWRSSTCAGEEHSWGETH